MSLEEGRLARSLFPVCRLQVAASLPWGSLRRSASRNAGHSLGVLCSGGHVSPTVIDASEGVCASRGRFPFAAGKVRFGHTGRLQDGVRHPRRSRVTGVIFRHPRNLASAEISRNSARLTCVRMGVDVDVRHAHEFLDAEFCVARRGAHRWVWRYSPGSQGPAPGAAGSLACTGRHVAAAQCPTYSTEGLSRGNGFPRALHGVGRPCPSVESRGRLMAQHPLPGDCTRSRGRDWRLWVALPLSAMLCVSLLPSLSVSWERG